MTNESGEQFLQIGEASERASLTQRTLRYYEEKGLLKPPGRMDGGFRLYSPDDLERIERIKELRDLLGFSLAEIKEMLEAEDVKRDIRAGWKSATGTNEKATQIRKARTITLQQLTLIDQKMAKMASMRDQLAERMEKYDLWLREHAQEASHSAAAQETSSAT